MLSARSAATTVSTKYFLKDLLSFVSKALAMITMSGLLDDFAIELSALLIVAGVKSVFLISVSEYP